MAPIHAFIERRVAISHARMTGAAALVLAAVSMIDMDIYPDQRRSQAEWTMAVQSTALACQNLLLAAHQAGLGACWMCAPLFVPELVRNVLQLPTRSAATSLDHAWAIRRKRRQKNAPPWQAVLFGGKMAR